MHSSHKTAWQLSYSLKNMARRVCNACFRPFPLIFNTSGIPGCFSVLFLNVCLFKSLTIDSANHQVAYKPCMWEYAFTELTWNCFTFQKIIQGFRDKMTRKRKERRNKEPWEGGWEDKGCFWSRDWFLGQVLRKTAVTILDILAILQVGNDN